MNKLVFIFTAAVFVFNVPTFASDCPAMPEQINKDWEVEVNAAIAKIGTVKGGELRTRTKNATKDLLGKLPDAGRIYLEQMMYSAYCSALRDDKTMKASERAKLLREYNKEVRKAITTAPSSSSKPAIKPSKRSGSTGFLKNPAPSDQMQTIADTRLHAANQLPTGVTPKGNSAASNEVENEVAYKEVLFIRVLESSRPVPFTGYWVSCAKSNQKVLFDKSVLSVEVPILDAQSATVNLRMDDERWLADALKPPLLLQGHDIEINGKIIPRKYAKQTSDISANYIVRLRKKE